jgi:hypothetical protein
MAAFDCYDMCSDAGGMFINGCAGPATLLWRHSARSRQHCNLHCRIRDRNRLVARRQNPHAGTDDGGCTPWSSPGCCSSSLWSRRRHGGLVGGGWLSGDCRPHCIGNVARGGFLPRGMGAPLRDMFALAHLALSNVHWYMRQFLCGSCYYGGSGVARASLTIWA